VLAQFPAIVSPEDYYCVVSKLEPVKFVEQATYQDIDVGNTGIIAVK